MSYSIEWGYVHKSGYGADTSGIQWADNATFETKINNGSLNLKVQDEYKDYYDKKLKLLKFIG